MKNFIDRLRVCNLGGISMWGYTPVGITGIVVYVFFEIFTGVMKWQVSVMKLEIETALIEFVELSCLD